MSYYAFLKEMAASKPTFWVQNDVYNFTNKKMLFGLSIRFGLFPFSLTIFEPKVWLPRFLGDLKQTQNIFEVLMDLAMFSLSKNSLPRIKN